MLRIMVSELNSIRFPATFVCVSLLAPQHTMTRNSLCKSPGIYLLTI